MTNQHSRYRRFVSWLGSRQFLLIILAVFVFEALWVALSGRFPMAFDEEFHLGIIKLYAHHLSPFFAHQPPGANALGAVARDPSYLYHYLMSFPWRAITVLTDNAMTQVILIRLINIALFTGGLVAFRKLLGKTGRSPALINTALLFFVLTPLASQVAAQINYDNLLILVVPLALLLALRAVERTKRTRSFDWQGFALLISLCLLASLVKYPFLPIFAGIVIWCLWRIKHIFASRAQRLAALKKGYRRMSRAAKLICLVGLVVTGGLFLERYGLNTLRYHTPIPECNEVLNIQDCNAYGAWARNYRYGQAKNKKTDPNPLRFSILWGRREGFNLMFALNGSASGFKVGKPLPLPRITARAIAYVSPVLVLLFWRRLFDNQIMRLFVLVSIIYVGALWLQNYADYLHLGQQVGVQGRYLLPILLFVYLAIAQGFHELLGKYDALKLFLLGVAFFCFIAGGGVLTFILHSDSAWYWPNQRVINANHALQRVLDPIVPGSHY